MTVFTSSTSSFDLKTFEECLKYVQDSVHWLVNNKHSLSDQPTVLGKTLTNTTNTLQSLIYKVKRFQNSMVPVNRLPSELLSEVFLFFQGDIPPISPTSELPPRSDPSQHKLDLVCWQWQQIIHNNPAFWARIDLASNTRPERVALLLSRSCAVPLSVYIDYQMSAFGNSLSELRPQERDVVSQGGRVRDLRVIHANVNFLNSFIQQASQLEIIVIKKHWHEDNERLPCTFAQMKVMSVVGTTLWHLWSTGNLRSISLGEGEWQHDSIQSLLLLLERNPRLEEILIKDISISTNEWDAAIAAVKGHSSITLPRLQRLLVQEPPPSNDSILSPMSHILSRVKVPRSCARHFCLAFTDADVIITKDPNAFPVDRLFVDKNSVVGTDDFSSWALVQADYVPFLLGHIDRAQIREMWLSGCREFSQSAPLQSMFLLWHYYPDGPQELMPNLTKLIVLRDVGQWFETLRVSSLAAVEELQIHSQVYKEEQKIIDFIADRKKRRYMLKTLRFVRDSPRGYDSESFASWRSDPSRFAKHVGEVVFEERFDDMESDRFEFRLPGVCNTVSPMHSAWQPWSTFIR